MNNKKILFIRTPPYDLNFNTYNIQQFGLGIAFCDLGFDFDFITFKKSNQKTAVFYEKDGCTARVIETPRKRISRWGFNFKLLDKQYLEQYYMVIVQEYYQPMTYLLAKKANNICLYNGPYWNLFRFKFISFFYDLFATKKMNQNLICKFTKSILSSKFLEKKGYTNLDCVGVGLDISKFKDVSMDSNHADLIEDMNVHKYILFVGNINRNKNVAFVIKVFDKLFQKDNNLKLLIVGKSAPTFFERITRKNKNGYFNQLLRTHAHHSKHAIVHLSNVQNAQLKFFYEKASVLVLPSKKEIFGMVMLEAMYFGLPVVSSFNGGSSTLIKNNNYGVVLESFDVDAWSIAIGKIIYDDNYSKIISKNAKTNVDDNFNWEKIAKQMLKSYNEKKRRSDILSVDRKDS